MDRGAWWVTVHGVTKNQTRLSNFHFHFQGSNQADSFGNTDQGIPEWLGEDSAPGTGCSCKYKDKENFNHEFTFLYFFMLPVGAPGTLAEPQGSSACDSEDRGGDLAEKQTHSY